MTREEAINELNYIKESFAKCELSYEALDMAIEALEEWPKTGKWIYHSDWEADGECGYECSECGMGSDVDYNYCMRCGCRMLKEGDEE